MDLTTVARYKTFMGGNITNMDPLISQIISRASDFVIRWSGRTFQRTNYALKAVDGTGTDRVMLPDNPIISVSAVRVGNTVIPVAATPTDLGYQYDDKLVYYMGGGLWPMARRNLLVSWIAGYAGSEAGYVPANPGPYTITPTTAPDGTAFAANDQGVVYTATGAALTRVGSAPAAGQYSFSGGVYTFAAADAGAAVTMSYDYVPGAVEQATLEMVALKIKQRDNIGIRSKSMLNESITYEDKQMTPSIMGLLQAYRRVAPI